MLFKIAQILLYFAKVAKFRQIWLHCVLVTMCLTIQKEFKIDTKEK